MSRTSASPRRRMFPTAGGVLLAIVALSACTSAPPLTFDRGDSLDSDVTIKWKDGLDGEKGWERDQSINVDDDDFQSWSYTRASGECAVSFAQGSIAGLSLPDDDDLTATNESFAYARDAGLLDDISTGVFRIDGVPGGVIEMRQGTIGTSEDSWMLATRVFLRADAGLTVNVSCADDDVVDEVFAEVIEKNPVVITP